MRNSIKSIKALLIGIVLTGCASTHSANITAYGVHAITPYGVISMGYLNYQRTTGEGELKTPDVPKPTIR